MTVFTRYGNAVKDPAAIRPVDAIDAEGALRSAYSKIPVNSDGITSLHLLARIPSSARIMPGSNFYTTALTGLTDYDVGFGVNGAVIAGKADALVNGADIHLAGTVSLVKDVAAGSLGKKVWELAGYSADPGGMIDVIGTVNAAASTAGTIESFLTFAK